MGLTDFSIRNLRPDAAPIKKADGGGLFLLVNPNGSKLWRIAYRFAGKQKGLSGGEYPFVSIAAARKWRDDCKATLAKGIDPSSSRKQAKAETRAATEHTFRNRAMLWLEAKGVNWGERYKGIVQRRLESNVFPIFGETLVGEIRPRDALAMLRVIESRNVGDLTKRIQKYCSGIMRLAVIDDLAESDPFRDIGDGLKKPPRVQHRARFPSSELPTFFIKLYASGLDDLTVLAIEWTLLTMVRTNETRFATVSEFEALDSDEPLWRIPAARMKMSSEHLIPLPRQAIPLLNRIQQANPSDNHLFDFPTRSGVISENRMLFGLYRMGYHSKATIHGFRGIASTVLNEAGFASDWIERQLAHVEGNQVRRAYNAAEWMTGRREMLQWWADFLDRQRDFADLIG